MGCAGSTNKETEHVEYVSTFYFSIESRGGSGGLLEPLPHPVFLISYENERFWTKLFHTETKLVHFHGIVKKNEKSASQVLYRGAIALPRLL